jgi:hypothetical protein
VPVAHYHHRERRHERTLHFVNCHLHAAHRRRPSGSHNIILWYG